MRGWHPKAPKEPGIKGGRVGTSCLSRRPPACYRPRRLHKGDFMSGESILVILLVGLIAGWLGSHIVRGTGHGLVADVCIGIVGALIGSWLLPRLGVHLGAGIVTAIIQATIGAVLLLVALRLVKGRGRW